jgi:hypothetical protein
MAAIASGACFLAAAELGSHFWEVTGRDPRRELRGPHGVGAMAAPAVSERGNEREESGAGLT